MIKGASPIPPQKGRANQLAWGGLAAMFKIVRLIFFALIRAIAHQRLIFLKDERL